jgi:hypothetical protein
VFRAQRERLERLELHMSAVAPVQLLIQFIRPEIWSAENYRSEPGVIHWNEPSEALKARVRRIMAQRAKTSGPE